MDPRWTVSSTREGHGFQESRCVCAFDLEKGKFDEFVGVLIEREKCGIMRLPFTLA